MLLYVYIGSIACLNSCSVAKEVLNLISKFITFEERHEKHHVV